jgi:hypothetical protein
LLLFVLLFWCFGWLVRRGQLCSNRGRRHCVGDVVTSI